MSRKLLFVQVVPCRIAMSAWRCWSLSGVRGATSLARWRSSGTSSEWFGTRTEKRMPWLIGVNLGPLLTPWGSLATLLWADRCRAAGVHVPWPVFAAAGAVLVTLLLLATVPLLP